MALVGRIHHAMADGVSAIRLIAGLLWDADGDPAAGERPPLGTGVRDRPAARPGPADSIDGARGSRDADPGAPSGRPLAGAAARSRHQARPAHRPGARGRLDELSARAPEADRARRRRGDHGQRRRPRGGRRSPAPLASTGWWNRRRPPGPVPGLPARARGGRGPARQPRLLHESRPADLRGRPRRPPSPDQHGDERAQARPRRRRPLCLLPRPRPVPAALPRRHPNHLRPARVRPLRLERAGPEAAPADPGTRGGAVQLVRRARRPPRPPDIDHLARRASSPSGSAPTRRRSRASTASAGPSRNRSASSRWRSDASIR